MKAVGYLKPGSIENKDALVDIEIPVPEVQGYDILVKVEAISVNPVDTKIRRSASAEDNQYKILGWDAAGEVVAIGDRVSLFKKGDQVWYSGELTRAGSNAEYQLVDERIASLKPKSLSATEAAALPLTAVTAWELLFDRLDFSSSCEINPRAPQPLILIIGAAGGVGSIMIQLVRKFTNAIVIATASREESISWVNELGCEYVINHHKPLLPQIRAAGFEQVTHAISLTHTHLYFEQLVDALAPQGKLALIDDPEPGLDISKLKRKSLSLHWEFMFTRSLFKTWDMQKQHEILKALAGQFDTGGLKTTLSENYGTINATNLKRAHALIESNKAIGKIVLQGFQE